MIAGIPTGTFRARCNVVPWRLWCIIDGAGLGGIIAAPLPIRYTELSIQEATDNLKRKLAGDADAETAPGSKRQKGIFRCAGSSESIRLTGR